ncbi:TPA: 6-phosphofructokinase [Clostridioides difficile]|nr:6-phosphofructokinase [Clostridioides difficile]MDI6480379.1 6-phosphofructokinase [Clostridioides difficile]HBF2077661.1 6-phosphofructokinase [Clostridioides difficile]HBF4434530.1 6-phosphofructokinase [Clostridioides difficile]HBF7873074.1 6-phosphofructokinase [Clostridioides difficile]
MRNCIIAQSGGPTAVINASAVGIYEKNLETKYFDKVYFGINGIEGILNKNIIDSDSLNKDNVLNLKQTPSSGLGSCRYKLADYKINSYDYDRVINILDEYKIDTLFYIGGNDSMDTVMKFSQYCKNTTCKIKFIGIPKTIDNDLLGTDNCPGFGSAAKLISTLIMETYLDFSIYKNNGIFIVETMGRDTGWLAASSSLARLNDTPLVDLIYLPEIDFYEDKFIEDVRKIFKEKNKAYIVASEGIRDKYGNFICEQKTSAHDKFGHSQLGGVSNYLKNLIVSSSITTRVKTLELGVIQRCAMHLASDTDLKQAAEVGAYGIELSKKGYTGVMAIINRKCNNPYKYEVSHTDISKIANKTKYFPKEWINEECNYITDEALNYLYPLIQGKPDIKYKNGLPYFSIIY